MESDPALPMPRTGLVEEAGAARAGLPLRALFIRAIAVLLIFGTGTFLGAYPELPFIAGFSGIAANSPATTEVHPDPAATAPETATASRRDGSVVALGRLQPEGKTITVAAPFGASDARIASLLVGEGDRVEVGQTLAELDSLPSLQLAVDNAKANLSARQAALDLTRAMVAASLAEAEASRDGARATVELARQALDRQQSLSQGGVSSRSALQSAEATLAKSVSDLAKSNAAIARYAAPTGSPQADIAVAERNIDLAKAELATAQDNLRKGRVVSSISGTVIAINSRPGERPGAAGIMTLGDTDRMQVELEVYQTDIRRVALGQAVVITSPALTQELNGSVTLIGRAVEQQTVLSADPAANTDARVVRVTAALDRRSSELAARLTGLEVIGHVAVGPDHE